MVRATRPRGRLIAAHQLEANPDDLEFADGSFSVKGSPGKAMAIQAVAFGAFTAHNLPDGMEPNLQEQMTYDPPNFAFPFGTHVAVVEVDETTGKVDLLRYVAIGDCGNQVNPLIVEGQVHGGLVQGIAQALWECASFDTDGNLRKPSLLDHLVPSAAEMPSFETGYTTTPSTSNPLGSRALGEAGTIGSAAAVMNAVCDALSPHGIRDIEMPATPRRVMEGHPGGKPVIPASFDYVEAASVDAAIAALTEHGDEAKLLAGGHSLIPLMRFRLATPSVLVDIGRLADLSYVRDGGDHLAIGALTRHRTVETDPLVRSQVPLLAHVAGQVGDPQVRHRGTLGGSLAHGEPASDLPAALLALGGSVVSRGPGGEREMAAADFFTGFLETALAPDELLTEVRVPKVPGGGWSFQKFNRRAQDWAIVGWRPAAPAPAPGWR
jgi:aerobic carbon-monoxide dehydrogenase medium subunit